MLIIPALAVLGGLVFFFLTTYRVVDANEAHIVVFMGRGRRVYSPKVNEVNGVKGKTSYFYIPFMMKRQVVPLTNVKMDIDNIHLNDKEVAPFVCDVIAWLHIEDPIKAAERLNFNHQQGAFASLHDDLINLVHAVSRAVAMKQEVLDIMRDRVTFSQSVRTEVDGVLQSWGVELINLEVNEIRDDGDKGSEVIQSYELMRRAKIESAARQEVAVQNNAAVQIEQDNRQKSEIATTATDEQVQKRGIERDQNVGIAKQEAEVEVAKRQEQANIAKVLAQRKLEVGQASVKKEASIEVATGEAEAIRIKGEKQAEVTKMTGAAEASAVEAKGIAEATAKDKMAEALKKFNEAGITLEQLRAAVEVKQFEFEALGKIAENAEIKVITNGEGGNLFGLKLDGNTGAALGQLVEAFGKEKLAEVVGKTK